MTKYDNEKVARRIRSLRIDKGYNQQELANAANIPLPTLRTYEQAQAIMSLENAARIAHALGCSIDVLACQER